MACRSRVAQPGAADGGGTTFADADEPGVEGVEDAEDPEAAEEAEDAAEAEEAEDAGADTDVVAEDTGGGAEDELPAAHPATTAPAAATPASLSNNETEPVITNHPF